MNYTTDDRHEDDSRNLGFTTCCDCGESMAIANFMVAFVLMVFRRERPRCGTCRSEKYNQYRKG